jgi:TMEM70/TMEM186/TMEM223 protein family
MLRVLSRYTRKHIPNKPIPFDQNDKCLIFEYDDDKIHKQSILVILGCEVGSIVHSYIHSNLYTSLIGLGIAGILSYTVILSAKETVKTVSLLKDGKNIEIQTFNFFKPQVYVFPIDKLYCVKGAKGFHATVLGANFLMDQEGRIPHPELFFAVMRGLSLENVE